MQRVVGAGAYALPAADAFRTVAVRFRGKLYGAGLLAGSAIRALSRFRTDMDQCDTVKQAVERAKRTQQPAERSEQNDRGEDDQRKDHPLEIKHAPDQIAVLFIRGNKQCAADRSLRADEFTKRRYADSLIDHHNQRDQYDKDRKDRVFEPSEPLQIALILGQGDLVEQLLHQPERTQPPADQPAAQTGIETDQSDHIEVYFPVKCSDRLLQRAERTGSRCGRA